MVLVRNVSNELVLVGESYLFPTEQRWVESAGGLDGRLALVVVGPSDNVELSDVEQAPAVVKAVRSRRK